MTGRHVKYLSTDFVKSFKDILKMNNIINIIDFKQHLLRTITNLILFNMTLNILLELFSDWSITNMGQNLSC